MSRTILSEVNGWTPLIDEIVQAHGVITASVFGRMWRYCQMEKGVCNATIEKIAGELNVSRMTIIRHIETLVNSGYLIDTTPDARNKPHVYADAGKIVMKSSITAVSKSDGAIPNSDSGYTNLIQHAIPNSDLKKECKKETKKEDKKEKIGAAAPGGKPARTPKPRDERLDNPAVIAYKDEMHLQAPETWRGDIVAKVTNLTLWKTILHEWIGRGWNKQNIRGLIEAYENGGIKDKAAAPTKSEQYDAVFAKLRERYADNGNHR